MEEGGGGVRESIKENFFKNFAEFRGKFGVVVKNRISKGVRRKVGEEGFFGFRGDSRRFRKEVDILFGMLEIVQRPSNSEEKEGRNKRKKGCTSSKSSAIHLKYIKDPLKFNRLSESEIAKKDWSEFRGKTNVVKETEVPMLPKIVRKILFCLSIILERVKLELFFFFSSLFLNLPEVHHHREMFFGSQGCEKQNGEVFLIIFEQ